MTVHAKDRTPEQWRSRASNILHNAITSGLLPKLSVVFVKCTDCDERATEYDHRDYRRPLKVDPVCRTCNNHRGPGKPWPEGYEGTPRRTQLNGRLWSNLDDGDGDTCLWFTGHALIEPDERQIMQHEEYLSMFHDEYKESEVYRAINELSKFKKQYTNGDEKTAVPNRRSSVT